MAGSVLSRLLRKNNNLNRILMGLTDAAGSQVTITDVEGELLIGPAPQPSSAHCAVMIDEEILGYVFGGPMADFVAALMAILVSEENEKKSLANELIERYRELNLLFRFSERMAASPRSEDVGREALDALLSFIDAQSGSLILHEENHGGYQVLSTSGTPNKQVSSCPLVERVIQTGKPELENAVPAGTCFEGSGGQSVSLLCAPLKTGQRTLGAILLVGRDGGTFSAGDLKLANSISLQIAPAIEIIRLYEIALENERFQRELLMARQVQKSLLPSGKVRIKGWNFARVWRPAREVSGDFYDMIREGRQRIGLVIADVTDKGMPAALFMVFARSALRACIRPGVSPAEAIANANRQICRDSHEGLFATMFYCSLDTSTGKLTYVNAGHNPALLYHVHTDQIQQLRRTGLPLGIESGTKYEQMTVQLDPGDFIFFYTDGITEAVSTSNSEFGLERLQEVVFGMRSESTDSILEKVELALNEFADSTQSFDDITMMVAMRNR